ncbi:MAG: DNA primase [Nitrospirae bacterium]|nr:DNA primase [Nitrospirota bacterium]
MKSQSISEEIIFRIQESIDIVQLISGYVSLKKSGQNFQGLCPFHSEKSPSFTVSPSKQIFHCFGCGSGGNVFKFLMLKEGMSFPDAVKELGKTAGVPVPVGRDENPSLNQELIQVNESAKDYFHQVLLKDPGAELAREYLKKRGIVYDSIRDFSLGYSLPGWNHCSQFLEKKGFTLLQMEKAGLITQNNSGGGYHDRFRGRLIFPVSNLQGKCIGFGGRVLDQALPKYLNSPETPVYQKGKVLYGLDKTKNEIDSLIIVEGYFDAIRPFQSGIKNVVATCGTALTHYHLQLIRRKVRKVYLIFDPDQAGIKAALRTIDLFLETGIKAFVVVLPGGLDPDLFVDQYGKEPFERCLEKAVPLFDFVLNASIQKNSGSEIEGKLAVIEEILPLVSRISNSVEKSYYLMKVSNQLEVSEKDLREEFKKQQNKKSLHPQKKDLPVKKAPTLPLEEEYVIRFLLAEKIAPDRIFHYVSPADFNDVRAKEIMQVLYENHSSEEKLNFRNFLEKFSGEEKLYDLMTALSVKEPDYDYPIQALEESLDRLIHKRMMRQRIELEKEIPLAEREKDHEKVSEISRHLLKIRAGLNEKVKL